METACNRRTQPAIILRALGIRLIAATKHFAGGGGYRELRNYLRRVCTHKQEIGFGRGTAYVPVVCIFGAASSLLARYLPTPAGIKGVYFAKGLHLHRELCVDTRTHSPGLTS
jgi:hypothetical protein